MANNTKKRLLTLLAAEPQQPRYSWNRRRRLFFFLAAGVVAVLVAASGSVVAFSLSFPSSSSSSSLAATSPITAHTHATTSSTTGAFSTFSHKLCVLTRVHNVPRSLTEWLEFHLALGVGHFFIFDDCSDDEGDKTAWVLDTYKRLGLISVFNAKDLTRWDCRANAKRGAAAGWSRSPWFWWGTSTSISMDSKSDKSDKDKEQEEECTYACGDRHRPDEDRLFSFLYQQMKARQAEGGGGEGGQGCEWTGVFDVDEYLTIHQDQEEGDEARRETKKETLLPSSALHALLDERSKEGLPVFQLPWVTMGSDGHVSRTPPEGLVIEGSFQGAYTAWMLKTLARTEIVLDWRHSHWPLVREGLRKDGWRVPKPFKSLKEYVERVWLREEESRTIFVEEEEQKEEEEEEAGEGEEGSRACRAPVSPLYLKHYFYRSFEEWEAHRGRSSLQPDGGPNTHLLDLRASWEEGQDEAMFWAPCQGMYKHDFTLGIMAPLVREALKARRRQWEEEGGEGIDGEGGRRGFPPVEAWLL